MIAGLTIVSFFAALALAYRIGTINGYHKGFDECSVIHEKNFENTMQAVKMCTKAQKGKQDEK